ncbi:MAG: response regulator [Planctomycetales bacterium]|nr:response regulator [Planctomycetales bacterium]
MRSRLLRIVVVEDDASLSQAIERVLRAGGYQPILFNSAEATLNAGIASEADCLVLDINLPGMSGFELYEKMNSIAESLPAIFITAHDEPLLRERVTQLGASGYYPKPFLGKTLLAAIGQALRFQ